MVYLSVKDFSREAKVTTQSVYKKIKRVDNPIQKYIKVDNNKVMISNKALTELYGIKVDNEVDNKVFKKVESDLKVEQPILEKEENINKSYSQLVELLSCQLVEKDKQLAEKDNQIKAKDIQISELNNLLSQAHTIIDRQQAITTNAQTLNAYDKQNLLEEAKTEERKHRKFFNIFNKS